MKRYENSRGHPLQSPVSNLQFPAVFPAHVPSRTLHHPANPLYSIIILSHPFDPRSLLISCSPTEPFPSLNHIFGMTCHLNPSPLPYLHHCHCQSQDIIFIRLLYPSTPDLSLCVYIFVLLHK